MTGKPAQEPYRQGGGWRACRLLVLLCPLLLDCACRQDMHDQPRYEPLEESGFFGDSRSARLPVPGTVPRGSWPRDEHLLEGKQGGEPAGTFPFPIDRQVLERGRQRYDIFCAPCHDRVGRAEGMIVRRGFKRPPSFHIERLREAPPGYFFDVITNGFGAMYDYRAQLSPRDRWAVVAYIRALQLAQNASLEDVPPEIREELAKEGQ